VTEEELLDRRWELLYRAEYSGRYHRRRAAFLSNLDTFLNLVTVTAGATTFGDLMSGSPGWLSKIGAAFVTLISIAQVILRLGAQSGAHTGWMKRWNELHAEMSLTTAPTSTDVSRWMQEQVTLETECVSELRALCLDCENIAAKVMNIPDRQRVIGRWQRLLIHLGTFQSDFPLEAKKAVSNLPERVPGIDD